MFRQLGAPEIILILVVLPNGLLGRAGVKKV